MKNLIKDFITKRIIRPKKYNYFFYRWLVSILYENKNDSAIISFFAWMYVHQQKFEFTDIFVIDNIVYIYTNRPGEIIGKGGETIDDITDKMNTNAKGEKINNYKIQIIEDLQSQRANMYVYFNVMTDY